MYLKLASYRKQRLLLASGSDNVSGITDPSDRSLTITLQNFLDFQLKVCRKHLLHGNGAQPTGDIYSVSDFFRQRQIS